MKNASIVQYDAAVRYTDKNQTRLNSTNARALLMSVVTAVFGFLLYVIRYVLPPVK
jgi:hypothetical protein